MIDTSHPSHFTTPAIHPWLAMVPTPPRESPRHSQPSDDRFYQFSVDVQVTLVLGEVALAMSLIEHAPLLGGHLHGTFQALKYRKSILGSVTVPSMSRK